MDKQNTTQGPTKILIFGRQVSIQVIKLTLIFGPCY